MIAIDWNPTHRFLRQFAGLFVLFIAIILLRLLPLGITGKLKRGV